MRRNDNGFTLIELLAVIVILAVIALIATPLIMNVINDAKKGAAKDAALGYIKAVETSIATDMVKNPNATYAATQNTVGTVTCTGCGDTGTATSITVNYKGTAPSAVALAVGNNGVGAITGTVTVNGFTYDESGTEE